ncbi:tannase/feruloyl esterase family alpha/beta hydrolase [Frankia tisae]|uniref:tannase/feruloyl esterase family alpha/beta hydrolase n=1 Tax=Frankia tisae TaxID=2950104 RepID=UPI0021BF4953|nr:tannase/feruloyl esterase family alpha/beta hydrolase [Frankia tisae]
MPSGVELRIDDYVVTDDYFGKPYIDVDEWRTSPVDAYKYRFVHGGFAGTDTRLSCYFLPADDWAGRMLFPVEGGLGGYEDTCGTVQGLLLDQLGIGFRLGAYIVESNAGHIGVELDLRAGPDPSLYGYRAHTESARFSKHLATQIYGTPPRASYAYGGGGGGMRAQLCLENSDVFDGAMPYVGIAATMDEATYELPPGRRLLKTASLATFGAVLNVQRLLGDKVRGVIDAVEPGGSGEVFAGLGTHQREELAALYRLGFSRGSEIMIAEPVGPVSAWSWLADDMLAELPEFFEGFWSEPGHVGHDFPELLAPHRVQATARVRAVVTAEQLAARAAGLAGLGAIAKFTIGMKGAQYPCALELDTDVAGYLLGASIKVVSGEAAGRSLIVAGVVGEDTLYVDGAAESGTLRMTDVVPGDEVLIDNRNFLAFCYAYRHQVAEWDRESVATFVDGRPVYPRHGLPTAFALGGGPASGSFGGKLLLLPGTHDANVWPGRADALAGHIRRVQGSAAADRLRLRWMENAENIPGSFLPSAGGVSMSTRYIDYNPLVEQSLHDLAAWVENGTPPVGTAYDYTGGRLALAPDARTRGGIQAVVTVTANGAVRAEVPAGEPVAFEVTAEVPPGAGAVVSAAWDFDGSGTFASELAGIDGQANPVQLTTTHAFDRPGTYFPAVRVKSHRDGDVSATSRLVPNLGRVRVVVR